MSWTARAGASTSSNKSWKAPQPTRATQLHLDRCLTCLNCETTCPSGVQYGRLIDIGRKVVDAKVQRPLGERLQRWALKEGLSSPLFAPAMKLGQAVRSLLPEGIRAKVPAKRARHLAGPRAPAQGAAAGRLRATGDAAQHQLRHRPGAGCRGHPTVVIDQAVCCGAVKFHLNDQEGGKDQMRANIDAWWPAVQAGGWKPL